MLRRTCELAKEGPSNTDRSNFGREDLRDVEIHSRVTEGTLKSEVQEHEQHTNGVTCLIICPSVQRDHGAINRSRDDDTDETGHVHFATRVDLVMKPSTARVVNKTSGSQPKGGEKKRHVPGLTKAGVEDNSVIVL